MINIGAVISGRYEIIEKVGTGGMADVYRAKDHRLNRYVAVKILKNEYSEDAKFVTKFRQEAQAIACLSHPNIGGVYDVGQEQDLPRQQVRIQLQQMPWARYITFLRNRQGEDSVMRRVISIHWVYRCMRC